MHLKTTSGIHKLSSSKVPKLTRSIHEPFYVQKESFPIDLGNYTFKIVIILKLLEFELSLRKPFSTTPKRKGCEKIVFLPGGQDRSCGAKFWGLSWKTDCFLLEAPYLAMKNHVIFPKEERFRSAVLSLWYIFSTLIAGLVYINVNDFARIIAHFHRMM